MVRQRKNKLKKERSESLFLLIEKEENEIYNWKISKVGYFFPVYYFIAFLLWETVESQYTKSHLSRIKSE